ncbi:hypothetical protein AAC387_Pa01g1167 [Persea americana]
MTIITNCELVCPTQPNDYPPLCYPPPPPPPPLSPIFSQNTFRIIIPVSCFASVIFLAIFSFFVVKLCYNRNTSTRPSAPTNTTTHQDHIRCNVGSSGLQESFINSITVCKYKRGEGLIEGTECSICLSEFHEDENLRLLPNCIHAFHLPCIDTWLKSNVNCPLCRMNVISNQMSSSSSSSLSFGSSDETQNQFGLGINGGNGVGGNHSHTHVDVSALEASSSPRVDCGLRPQSDLGAVEMMNADIQLVRITVSMDSAAASVISEEAPQLTELVQSKENRSQASLDSDNKQNNGSLF